MGRTKQLRPDLQYLYTPSHSSLVEGPAFRVFIKRSLSGVPLMDQPTVVYGFAKEGGGYSLGEMKIKLAKEGLAMYSPSTKCQDNRDRGLRVRGRPLAPHRLRRLQQARKAGGYDY